MTDKALLILLVNSVLKIIAHKIKYLLIGAHSLVIYFCYLKSPFVDLS